MKYLMRTAFCILWEQINPSRAKLITGRRAPMFVYFPDFGFSLFVFSIAENELVTRFHPPTIFSFLFLFGVSLAICKLSEKRKMHLIRWALALMWKDEKPCKLWSYNNITCWYGHASCVVGTLISKFNQHNRTNLSVYYALVGQFGWWCAIIKRVSSCLEVSLKFIAYVPHKIRTYS